MMTPEDERELIQRRLADTLRKNGRDETLTNMTEQRNEAIERAEKAEIRIKNLEIALKDCRDSLTDLQKRLG